MREIVTTHGPDAVAFYASGQLLTEEYYLASKLARGFVGTNNFDTNSRLCMASAATGYARSLGSDGPPASYEDIDLADCFLLLGTNTADCHPVTFKRIGDGSGKPPTTSASSSSIRAGPRPPTSPTSISRCGPAPTSRC